MSFANIFCNIQISWRYNLQLCKLLQITFLNKISCSLISYVVFFLKVILEFLIYTLTQFSYKSNMYGIEKSQQNVLTEPLLVKKI